MLKNLVVGVTLGILAIGIIAVVGVVGAIPVYFLWNWLMPEIFGIKVITFWQSWGIVFFSGILFRGTSSTKSS